MLNELKLRRSSTYLLELCDIFKLKLNLPELFNLRKSTIYLVTHSRNHVKHWDHILLVNEGLAPYFCIDFLAKFKVLTDVVFGLGDSGQFLASVNVKTSLGLAEVGAALYFVKLCSHIYSNNYKEINC